MTKSASKTIAKPAQPTTEREFVIKRRKDAKSKWVATNHVVSAVSANAALRKFGMKGAFVSTKVRVCQGGQTGRQYTATPKG